MGPLLTGLSEVSLRRLLFFVKTLGTGYWLGILSAVIMFGGYVIPRRVAGDGVVSVVHGGHDGNNTVGSVVRGRLSRTRQ